MKTKVSRWDASEYLSAPEDVVGYLNAAIEENDPALLQAALGDVAKAQGMTQMARDAGVVLEGPFRLSKTEWDHFMAVLNVMEPGLVEMPFMPTEEV